jgi:hypothetical protein
MDTSLSRRKQSIMRRVESVTRFGPNVIGFALITGNHKYSYLGGYIPPLDMETMEFIKEALSTLPLVPRVFLGDLNVDLERLRDDRTRVIATMVAELGLEDFYRNFLQTKLH